MTRRALWREIGPREGMSIIEPPDGRERTMKMPNPTPEMLASPEFEAVWQTIKSWDVNVPEAYGGYCGANGSHVAMILLALKAIPAARQPEHAWAIQRVGTLEALLLDIMKRANDPDIILRCEAAFSPSAP